MDGLVESSEKVLCDLFGGAIYEPRPYLCKLSSYACVRLVTELGGPSLVGKLHLCSALSESRRASLAFEYDQVRCRGDYIRQRQLSLESGADRPDPSS